MVINSWLTINPESGASGRKIITASTSSDYTGRDSRSATFKITCDTNTAVTSSVTVTQNGADLFVSATTSAYTVDAEDASVSLNLRTNVQYLRIMVGRLIPGANLDPSGATFNIITPTYSACSCDDMSVATTPVYPRIYYRDMGTFGSKSSYQGVLIMAFPQNTGTTQLSRIVYVSDYDPDDTSSITATNRTVIASFSIKQNGVTTD